MGNATRSDLFADVGDALYSLSIILSSSLYCFLSAPYFIGISGPLADGLDGVPNPDMSYTANVEP